MNQVRSKLLSATLCEILIGIGIIWVPNGYGATSPLLGSVLTYHNDLARTGQNNYETILNRTNVNTTSFGKIASLPVDGLVYAQPLYAQDVNIGFVPRNIIVVATEHDSVYAFDAETLSTTPLWQRNFLGDSEYPCSNCTTLTSPQVNAPNIEPEIGITATPTIDLVNGILYVVAAVNENAVPVIRIHALDLTSGRELKGSPFIVDPVVPGTGFGTVKGKIAFNALRQLPRAGLALNGETLWVAFSSYNDQEPAHGWIVAYNAKNFKEIGAWMSTPHSGDGNIWMAGDGPAIDTLNGSAYFATGNGDPALMSALDYADCVVRVATGDDGVHLVDYFKPFNWLQLAIGGVDASGYNLTAGDVDLGSGGVMLLPKQPGKVPYLMMAGGKEGTVYLLNRENLGKLVKGAKATANTQIVQELVHFVAGGKNYGPGIYSTPAYFEGKVFMGAAGDAIRSIPVQNGLLNPAGMQKANEVIKIRGSTPSISSDGAANGIVWMVDPSAYTYAWNADTYTILTNGPAILRAYSTDDLSAPLYSSSTLANDAAGNAIKFGVPTVAAGKVFFGTQTEISVYGLRDTFAKKAAAVTNRQIASVVEDSFFGRFKSFFFRIWTWITNLF